jgi:hypothetical protein
MKDVLWVSRKRPQRLPVSQECLGVLQMGAHYLPREMAGHARAIRGDNGMSFLQGDLFIASEAWRVGVLAFAFAGLAGFLSGLLYRAGAAIVLSFIALIAAFALSISHGWSLWLCVLYAFGTVTAVQIGYLLGVALTVTHAKVKANARLRARIQSLFRQDTAP